MLDVRDVVDDVREHFVNPIPKPSFERLRQRSGDEGDNSASGPESGNEPLLEGSVSSSSSVVENGRVSSTTIKISDGSLSFSVDDMKVQQRSQRSSPRMIVEEEKEGTTTSSISSGSSSNDDENRSTKLMQVAHS